MNVREYPLRVYITEEQVKMAFKEMKYIQTDHIHLKTYWYIEDQITFVIESWGWDQGIARFRNYEDYLWFNMTY